MTALVKYFDTAIHTGITAGWDTNTAGSILGLLQSILVDGFNLKTVSTLTRSGTTATCYVSTGHGLLDKQVVLIAGATGGDAALYNGEFRITYVDANNFTYTMAGTPSDSATGTITSKTAPLGWTKPYSGTNKAAFLPASGAHQVYYRIEEPATQTITNGGSDGTTVVSYASQKAVDMRIATAMSGIDTYTEWARMFIQKIDSGSTKTGCRLVVVGDDRSAWIITPQNYQTNGAFTLSGIGDLIVFPNATPPVYRGMLWGKPGWGGSGDGTYQNSNNMSLAAYGQNLSFRSCVVCRDPSGTNGPVTVAPQGVVNSSYARMGGDDYKLSQYSMTEWWFPLFGYAITGAKGLMGSFAGLYHNGNTGVTGNGIDVGYGKTLPTPTGPATRDVLYVLGTTYGAYNTYAMCAIDITGPWR